MVYTWKSFFLSGESFSIHVNVAVSDQFLGWIFALGEGVKILASENVVERMKIEVKKAYERYL